MASTPPRERLAAMLIASVACVFANRYVPLILALIVVIALLYRAGILHIYLKFAAGVLLPTTAMLLIVWGLVARAPPSMPMGSDPRGGAAYAGVIALRISVLGGILQLALLSIPPRLLPVTLRACGLRGEGLVVALGVFAIGPELKLRAEQIITARKARGLIQTGRIARFREITRLLRPLFVWSIRSAVQRSEAWQQRTLLLKVDQLPFDSEEFSPAGGIAILVLSIAWLAVAIFSRWHR